MQPDMTADLDSTSGESQYRNRAFYGQSYRPIPEPIRSVRLTDGGDA